MTEFDLVETNLERVRTPLQFTHQYKTGKTGHSVLECWFGPELWSDRLRPEEIPGWQPLSEGKPGKLKWAGNQVSYDGQVFLQLVDDATVSAVAVSDLKGLLTRKGDRLPDSQSKVVRSRWSLGENTHLYGLGQRSGPLERTGLTASNWTTDSPVGHNRTTDPLYQAHPLLWGVTGKTWWALLLCHTSYSHFDLAQSELGILECLTVGPSVCFQFHAAGTPRELLASLRQTLCDPATPPLWSLGFHQSRWGYKSASEIDILIRTFREKALPLDVVHLDIDHMDDYRSFTFDPEHFPEPKERFLKWREDGVRAVTIIDPGLKFDTSSDYHPALDGLQKDHFIRSTSGAPQVGYCWPDEALFPDFSRQATRDWWAELCQFYLDHGISGLWIDMNEPAIFDKPFWTGGAEQNPMPLDTPWGEKDKRLDHLRLRNVYGSFMSAATRNAWTQRETRPWVLTRSGFTGVGSQAWSWMGDNTSWWEHLALSLPQLASMGLSNSSFVGVDIGGFFGNCDGELYGAWMEASVVYPFMRAHSAMGTSEQHPWSFGPEIERVAKKALDLRYRLLPYLYSAGLLHCRGGDPLLRPMFFDYPEDRRFRFLEDQVMLGPSLMACPFLKRGEEQRLIYLPDGEWFDFHTGEKVEARDGVLVAKRSPGLVPLFVKSGHTIACFEKGLQSTHKAQSAALEFHYFPGEGECSTLWLWDRGEGGDDGIELELCDRLGGLQMEARQWESGYSSQTAKVVTHLSGGSRISETTTLGQLVNL